MYGVSVAKEEGVADYKYALEHFFKSIEDLHPPRIIVIERNSNIRKAFVELNIQAKYGTKL